MSRNDVASLLELATFFLYLLLIEISLTNSETAPAYLGVKFSLYGNKIDIFFIMLTLIRRKLVLHFLAESSIRNYNLIRDAN